METIEPLSTNNRLGLHYFPDTLHYRVRDLEVWLPQLTQMGVRWLTLLAPIERSIPEYFLNGLLASGIQPILHFQLPANALNSAEGFRLLFSSYARWGVQYVALYDRPNSRSNWSPAAWAQMDLVERFLDQFLPLAESALDEGLVPVFPPLEPGGDYWDISFLQSALRGMQRRGRSRLLDKLALGAYAWTGNHSLDWGAGGPERWSKVTPYSTPADSEDQLGFRIFDWYLSVSQRELGRRLPLFLLRTGSLPQDHRDPALGEPDFLAHADQNQTIARLLANETVMGCAPIPAEVKAACFWVLAVHEKSIFSGQGWFRTEEEKLPVVTSFYRFSAQRDAAKGPANAVGETVEAVKVSAVQDDEKPADGQKFDPQLPERPAVTVVQQVQSAGEPGDEVTSAATVENVAPPAAIQPAAPAKNSPHTISHYVLLPLYAWGVADWDLEVIQPLLQETHPTVGFSLAEARMAARVTVVGGDGAISAEALDMLRAYGCKVERVLDDGTLVAS